MVSETEVTANGVPKPLVVPARLRKYCSTCGNASDPALRQRSRCPPRDARSRYNPAVTPDQSPVGCTGTLLVATRGGDGPGEVLVSMRGGTEAYLAWSEEPLARGSTVLVFDSRGERAVDVMQWNADRAP